ncbi:MAG TPA: hypothetical protein VMH04_11675 [Candidatus Solibacter sp.]|nr:hypothetical protein [Candidatus Solibacter sp.]
MRKLHFCARSFFAKLPTSSLKFKLAAAAVFVWVLAFSTAPTWAQANVNESSETASVYVDASKGSDSNNGTKTAPLKTIGASVKMALANNDSNTGTKVIINPGTYRESVVIGGTRKSTNAPITFQAATNGTVFVSGADVISGWTAYQGSSSIYEATWPYNFALCPVQPPPAPAQQVIMQHVEMLIVNGTPLTQVLTSTALLPGTFYVDAAHSLVYMYPAVGTNVSSATVEAAARPMIWQISGQNDVVMRGLTFQYANSCPQNAAVMIGGNSTNILFDTDTIQWNNAMGLDFTTVENFTVQNSSALHNGQVGFASHEVKNTLYQSDTANYNNWRGAQSAFYTWETGGTKWMWDHSATYKNMVSNYNQANGVAWDTDNENVTFTGAVSAWNLVNGIQIEKTEGPFTLSSSYFCYDNLLGIGQRGGVAIRNSEQISLTSNTLYGSLINQLAVVGQPGGIQISNWETGQSYNLVTEKFSASSNIFGGPTAAVLSDSYLGGSDWTTFVNTVKSNSNTFYSGAGTKAFVVPTPKSGTDLDLASWQSATGQDKSSSWKTVTAPGACNVAASAKDFWLTSSTYAGVTASKGTATIQVGTLGLAGITGNVALSLQALPSGIKGTFAQSSIPTTGATNLTMTVSSSVPRGTYPITIMGNLGNTTHTVTVSLFVQ